MSARGKILPVAVLLCVISQLLVATHAAAQSPSGTIQGRVTEASTGQPLANITVEIADVNGLGAWTLSSADGHFSASGLAPGYYYARTRNNDGYLDELYWNHPCGPWCNILAGTPIKVTAGATTGFIDFALDRPGRIAGRVTRFDGGGPVGSATVQAFDLTGHALRDAYTDAAGAYEIHTLPPGTYFVQASALGYMTARYGGTSCSSACDPLQGAPVTVAAGESTGGIDFGLRAAGTITGRVTDATTGAPVAGIEISLQSSQYSAMTSTGADGTYTRAGLPAGQYNVLTRSYPPDYLDEVYDDVPCSWPCSPLGKGVLVPVVEGSTTPGIDFALVRGGRLSGTVTDEATTNSIPWITVRLWDANGGFVDSVQTDTTGQYTFRGLKSGSYYVATVDAIDYLNEVYQDVPCTDGSCTVTAGTAVPVTVASTTAGIDFALTPAGRITGRLTSATTGQPIAGYRLELSVGGAGFSRSEYTDGDGRYVFRGLTTAGSYYVRTAGTGAEYADELFDDVPCPNGSCSPGLGQAIPVALSQTTGDIDFALVPISIPPATGSVSGTVTASATGQPIASARVELLNALGQYVRDTYADAAGAYILTGLSPGDYYVLTHEYQPRDYVDELFDDVACPRQPCSLAAGQLVPVAAGSDTGGVNFALNRAAHISGRVTDVDGGPLGGARVELIRTNGSHEQTSWSASDGTYLFTGVMPGSYYVRTNGGAPGWNHLDEVFDGVPCFDARCDLELGTRLTVAIAQDLAGIDFALAPAGRISGIVTDALTGEPVRNVSIDVTNTAGWGSSTPVGQSGEYTVSGLVPGTYYVRTNSWRDYLNEAFDDVPCQSPCAPTIGAPISIASGTSATAHFQLLRSGRITGRVTDAATGTPLWNVEVRAVDAAGQRTQQTSTDSSGAFVFSGLAPGPFFVSALPDPSRYVAELYDDVPCAGGNCVANSGKAVVVAAASTSTAVNFALTAVGSVAGRVTDTAAGRPIVAAWVFVHDAVSGRFIGAALSGADGTYRVNSLPAGRCRVTTDSPGDYLDEAFDNVPCTHGCSAATATAVTVLPFKTTHNIDFALDRGGQITGTAFDAVTGRLLSSVAVDVYDATGTPVTRVWTGAEGTYASAGVQPGTYHVKAWPAASHAQQLFRGMPCMTGGSGSCPVTSGTPVVIKAQENATAVDFPLECSVQVPSTTALPAAGGAGEIDVVAVDTTCTWRATADPAAPWLVLGDAAYTGSHTLHVTASANSGAARTATITIAGMPVTVTQPAASGPLTYYLAEGATGEFFDLDISIANPNDEDAPVEIRFLKEGGGVVPLTMTIGALRRVTIRVDAIAGLESTAVSTVVTSTAGLPLAVERTMFWDGTHYGGHGEKAVSAAATRWYFAEGFQGFFDTYLLIANPEATAAHVTFTFLREGEAPVTSHLTVAGQSRSTLWAGDIPDLAGRAFATVVEADSPIICERAMYFGTARPWDGGHDSAGVTSPSTHWFLAEGATGKYFDTYVLVANPNDVPADVMFTFMRPDGVTFTTTRTVGALARMTVAIEGVDPALADTAVSTTIVSTEPVVVERAMYWPETAASWSEAHNAFGVTGTGTRWGLGEGRAGGAEHYETYILITNTGADPAEVKVTFLREGAPPIDRFYTVGPSSRFDIAIPVMVPELSDAQFGAVIESLDGMPLAVERAMYWNANGQPWAGGTNAAAARLPE